MCVECYSLSSPQINNGPFDFNHEEWKGRKRTSYMSERKKKANIRKKEMGRERRSNNSVHQMLIFCFSGMEGKQEKVERE